MGGANSVSLEFSSGTIGDANRVAREFPPHYRRPHNGGSGMTFRTFRDRNPGVTEYRFFRGATEALAGSLDFQRACDDLTGPEYSGRR